MIEKVGVVMYPLPPVNRMVRMQPFAAGGMFINVSPPRSVTVTRFPCAVVVQFPDTSERVITYRRFAAVVVRAPVVSVAAVLEESRALAPTKAGGLPPPLAIFWEISNCACAPWA